MSSQLRIPSSGDLQLLGNIVKRGDKMETSAFRIAQLLDPAGAYRSVAPVHHGGHADFSADIQNVICHFEGKISAHFCGIAVNFLTPEQAVDAPCLLSIRRNSFADIQ